MRLGSSSNSNRKVMYTTTSLVPCWNKPYSLEGATTKEENNSVCRVGMLHLKEKKSFMVLSSFEETLVVGASL